MRQSQAMKNPAAILGSKGGKRKTPAQQAARKANAEKAREAKQRKREQQAA
jgi:hypothetical protein